MYALILTLCSFSSCNGYVIATDTEWHTPQQCDATLVRESDDFAQVWGFSLKGMKQYLDRFNVQEDVQTLVDYDFTCEKVAQDDMP